MNSSQHPGVQIRLLQSNDTAEWLRLREALWPEQTPAQNEQEMADIQEHFDQMPVFVAERPDGGLCGLMEVALHEHAPGCSTTKIGYLEGWYVDPEWRRLGIGRQLVQAAEAWALAQGCTEMASDTDSGYPLSPAAHAHLGYQEVGRSLYFRKVLGNPNDTLATKPTGMKVVAVMTPTVPH
jgi:aminoglycoside 6'-N-acetyltransferase I